MSDEINGRQQRLEKLINSDFALPAALLLLAGIVGAMERGFLNAFIGIIAVLVFLGSALLVTSFAEIISPNGDKKFSIYIILISAIVVFAPSLGLYANNLEKVIVIALIPGAVLGVLIYFLSKR